jgi:hypothetical protein
MRTISIALLTASMAIGLFGCEPQPELGPFEHLLQPASSEFLQVSSYDTTGGNRDRLEIPEGDTVVLLDAEGPGIIQRIWITVSSSDPHYLRRIALEMYWDDEEEPSVAVPLGDFFGNGFDKRHYMALPMGVSSGGFYAYLPMPFRRRARIVVRNGTGREIDAFYYNIGLTRVDRLPADVQTFHAWWHRDIRTDDSLPHLVLDARGRGVFAGLSYNAESYENRLWYLEGDEIIHIDGEFRGQGTGTEDYFNGGWYFDQGEFAGPYHGLVVKDDARGRIATYRWHIPDPIPFHDSLRFEIEHGHANTEVIDLATVAYWYQREPHHPLAPLPPANERRILGVKIPQTATLRERLDVAVSADRRIVTVPVPRPDRYEVVVYPMGGPDAGTATFAIAAAGRRAVDLSTPEPDEVLEGVHLGVVGAEDEVVVELVGGAAPLPAAVDVRPVRAWATEWNAVGPFPNPRVLGTELSPAVDSVYGPEHDPGLTQTFRGWGGRRVGWRRVRASDDGQIRLNAHFDPSDWVAAYVEAFLYSPTERDVTLLFGADDAHVLWVNGERLSERQGRHISRADELEVMAQLHAGWNRVLLKVADLDGGWAFQMRAADPDGMLRWSPVAR